MVLVLCLYCLRVIHRLSAQRYLNRKVEARSLATLVGGSADEIAQARTGRRRRTVIHCQVAVFLIGVKLQLAPVDSAVRAARMQFLAHVNHAMLRKGIR